MTILDPRTLYTEMPSAVRKMDPRIMAKNPVMFVVEIGAVFTSILAIQHSTVFSWWIVAWLWGTVLFANLAEAIAEGRGKAQADSLRKTRTSSMARLLAPNGTESIVASSELTLGSIVVCEAGDLIPSDGEIIEGIASVDESAITGESAPVIVLVKLVLIA